MRLKLLICLILMLITGSTQSGCVLVAAVAAGAYASGKADEDRKAFHEHNLEREKAGLPPLTKEQWLEQRAASTPEE